MTEEAKKRRAKKVKVERPEEITNEFYMPFEEAVKKILKAEKKTDKRDNSE